MSSEDPGRPGAELFFVYSHEDERLRAELETHLALLRHEGWIASWHDRRIGPGQEWAGEIEEHLSSADVILLLVSPSFLASEYIWNVEMGRALERHAAGEARVIPVILRPVDWAGAPFAKLRALPADARPITSWPDRDEAFLDLTRGLRAAIVEGRIHIRDRLRTVEVRGFSAFDQARLDLSPGVNVFIGRNATGKSHLMKLAYALPWSWAASLRQESGNLEVLKSQLRRKMTGVFQPAEGQIGRLVGWSHDAARMRLSSERGALELTLPRRGELVPAPPPSPTAPQLATLFIPSREVLAMYEGFVAAYDGRELSFDETYYDLCKAMSASPLRSNHLGRLGDLLTGLEELVGGEVRLRGQRFYVEHGERRIEAHLLAEGLRKIAVVAHLIQNGALNRNSILFWDEPEANLNPGLITRMAETLERLAAAGLQVILATHDYLLAHELSLKAEHPSGGTAYRFFSFYREEPGTAVVVEQASTLAEVEHNPILEEYAAHHEREQILFERSLNAQVRDLGQGH